MTSKEIVRLNLYKKMLEEEKRKNKRLKAMFLSVFVVGVFSLPVYDKYSQGGLNIPGQFNSAANLSNKRINLEQLLEEEIFMEKQVDMSQEELLSELSI
jgi:hypothetical protein